MADDLFENGSQQLTQGNIQLGESMVSDAINYYEQIFGSVHPELANRYHELAVSYHQLSQPLIRNIGAYETSKEANSTEARQKAKADTTIESDEMLETAKRELKGFVESAVQMNRQSVIVAERTLGPDHYTTAQQYVDLAILEHANGDIHLGLKLCRHAIELLEQIYGPNHSEAIRAIVSFIYQTCLLPDFNFTDKCCSNDCSMARSFSWRSTLSSRRRHEYSTSRSNCSHNWHGSLSISQCSSSCW